MQIYAHLIDDFKTDRKGISPPLPIYLRLLPILLYLTIVAAILLNGIFVVRLSQAGSSKDVALERDRRIQGELKKTKESRTALEKEAKKASDIVAWLDASRPLQPLVVAIARSIEAGSSILSLRLDRDAENPAQIRFSIRIASETPRQLDLTLAKIADLRFRAFTPQQTSEKGEFDYSATLIWLDAAARDRAENSEKKEGS